MTDLFPAELALPELPEPIAVHHGVHGGLHVVWRFPNGRGASVIKNSRSYGAELAVIRYTGEGADDFILDMSTPVTFDVIGWLTPGRLADVLRQIRELPAVAE